MLQTTQAAQQWQPQPHGGAHLSSFYVPSSHMKMTAMRQENAPPKTWHQSGYRIVQLERERFLSSWMVFAGLCL
jgi:hypothetical protein